MNFLQTIAIIPAYQPEPVLLELLESLNLQGFVCIVVDDGSGSEFEGLFKAASRYATILKHEQNKGKGRALKTALEYLNERKFYDCTVVTLDADGQHTPEDAICVRNAVLSHPDSLVLGSRRLNAKAPLRSRLGNGITRRVYKLFTGISVYDTQTGLRGFSGRLIPKLLEINGERYEYEMNVLLDFARRKQEILEIEINTIYIDGNKSSHFDAVRDSARIYKEILKFSGSSFLCFLIDYSLYSVLTAATSGMGAMGIGISNVCARAVSSGVNFTLNRKYVFKSSIGVISSAVRYFLLALVILLGNTLVLSALVNAAGINRYIGKLITELIFFMFSWFIQHKFVYGKRIR